ncbi:Inner membrane transport protein YdhC [Microbacterium lemovicicum]|uniref:Inner membrane transport protein YdhC n=1 Tax=Microbacterium lemovicicum TaxID=1072463 RepID=A0A3Q9J2C1_9MICO|nr:MFS transporter [Microbacterium lemovicicum]AZS38534.1 Inner membrane transport protein YdhC [Microbacterium lemovicicum]
MTSASTTTHRTHRAGTLQGILLLAGSCMPVLGSVLITPVLPQLSAHFADVPGAAVLVPMIVAIPALFIAIFAPFAGQIVDRVGRKPLLIIAMFAYALVGTAPAWMEGLTEILVSRVLVGICEAAIMTVCTALIVDYFHDQRRNRYLAAQTVTTTLAATVFIALGGALGGTGWHTPFWVYGISVLIAVPMIFALWEPRASSGRVAAEQPQRVPIPWRRIAVPLLVSVFGGFTFYVIIIEVSYLVVGTGIDATNTAVIGAVAGGASLATAIGGILFARLVRRADVRLIPVAFAIQAVGMIVIWVVPALGGVVAGAVIASFGSGLLLPSLLRWVVATTAFAERGRVTGLWTASFFFGQFLTPILVGIVAGILGGLALAVGVIGIIAAVVAVATGLSLRNAPPQTDVDTAAEVREGVR